jgi:hypothetical protein
VGNNTILTVIVLAQETYFCADDGSSKTAYNLLFRTHGNLVSIRTIWDVRQRDDGWLGILLLYRKQKSRRNLNERQLIVACFQKQPVRTVEGFRAPTGVLNTYRYDPRYLIIVPYHVSVFQPSENSKLSQS